MPADSEIATASSAFCVALRYRPAAVSDSAQVSRTSNRPCASSLFGYVYVSENGGLSWRKLDREFGEARAIAWLPH